MFFMWDGLFMVSNRLSLRCVKLFFKITSFPAFEIYIGYVTVCDFNDTSYSLVHYDTQILDMVTAYSSCIDVS